ncbi:hypothetical protein QCA50_016889 [Cerrena zonata]|uniref:F-box domain-containing protein n=1 Tax=Cerrena zonata TaxID=2478898 RepID=A0AAW0FE68_9APHY
MVRRDETTHGRSRVGGLRDMLQMPLDILFEIFGHLTPGDLLNLSCTSKPFRKLLTSRESNFLWKEARGNVPDMPDCPSFLSEQSYANLWFSHHCYICRRRKGRAFWELGARYCSTCEGKLFHYWFHACDDFQSFNKGSLFPIPGGIIDDTERMDIALLRHKPTIENIKKRWAGIVTDDQRKEAIVDYRMWKDERAEFAEACNAWLSRCKNVRKKEIIQLKRNRMEEVCRRLEELGRGEDLEYSNQFYSKESHPLWKVPNIIQSKPWTEPAWKKMEGKILDVMDTARAERLFAIRRAAIEPRAQLLEEVLVPWRLSVGIVSPHTHDLLLIPEVRSLIDVPPDGKGSEVIPVTREDLEKLEPVFYRYHREWKQKQLEKIIALVSVGFKLPRTTDILALAVSQFFMCSVCAHALRFPNGFLHHCIRGTRSLHREHKDTYESVITDLTHCRTTTALYIALADPLRKVIVACGQDPATITADEMDNLDVRLECRACQVDGVLDAYNWREAFHHSQDTHSGHKASFFSSFIEPPVWKQVASTYLLPIQELEVILISRIERRRKSSPQWCCAHCPRRLDFDLESSKHYKHTEVISHLATAHAIHNPTETDYFSTTAYEKWWPAVHVSLIWMTPVSQGLQYKLTNEEARIIDPPPDEVQVDASNSVQDRQTVFHVELIPIQTAKDQCMEEQGTKITYLRKAISEHSSLPCIPLLAVKAFNISTWWIYL